MIHEKIKKFERNKNLKSALDLVLSLMRHDELTLSRAFIQIIDKHIKEGHASYLAHILLSVNNLEDFYDFLEFLEEYEDNSIEVLDGYMEALEFTLPEPEFYDDNDDEQSTLNDQLILFEEKIRDEAINDVMYFILRSAIYLRDDIRDDKVSYRQIGNDLLLSRDRCGVGFLDRDFYTYKEELERIAEMMGEQYHLYQ